MGINRNRLTEEALVHPNQRLQGPCGRRSNPKARGAGTVSEVPMVVFTMHLGPVLTPQELFTLCAAHSSLWYNTEAFVGWLAAAQHGCDKDAVANFRQLRELEQTPRLYVLNFSSPKFLVESGVFLTSTLQRGRYRVSITGWQNPNLNSLGLWLDDVRVTDPSGLKGYSHEATERHAFPAFEVDIQKTGKHVWRFETNYRQRHSQNSWMSLAEFRVECVGPAEARRRRTIAWLRAVAHHISHLLPFSR